ncbi:hypothetical protein P170DRAFT_415935 [Aspergillus steynii IBT 23096]|uniref:F-box domain-containing protein n=1 Tax=Aspergillus steynii IBT 23096 TaxID=1392250 RepID=A0A2I2FWK8_9EURO|nr:uncharacterized protein P170DRAFT_415935 [Aspergillus steynii IBT 23096]PLB45029.1 hypothetical protein P170DRAFT_415935 [Aspergillus steynii IBT 23096]
MTDILSLPNEIIHRIAYYADRDSLLSLRLVCRVLSVASKQWLFRSTCVVPTDESCERLENILDDSTLASCITKVYLDTTKWDHKIEIDEYDNDEEEEIFLPRRFSKFFDRLKELPRLQGVVLRFAHECYGQESLDSLDYCDQEPPFRHSVMKSFMKALASLPQPIRELGIRDLQNINETDEEVFRDIKKVLAGLHTLRLNVTNEHSEGNGENDLEQDEPHKFFPELSSFWLQPTLANLQHLTIYSSNYFGFYPKFDPRKLHFPHLKTLALGNHAFVHDSQLSWILSHADTLTELYLDDCPILYEVSIYDKERTFLDPACFISVEGLGDKGHSKYEKRWYDYFNAFKDGLSHLRHFRFGHCPHWWEDDSTPFEQEQFIQVNLPEDRYMVFSDGLGPTPYTKATHYYDGPDGERPDCFNEDKKALEKLCAKLGQEIEEDEW